MLFVHVCVYVCVCTNVSVYICGYMCMCATESYSTVVWNIKYSAVLAAVIKSRGSIAGV